MAVRVTRVLLELKGMPGLGVKEQSGYGFGRHPAGVLASSPAPHQQSCSWHSSGLCTGGPWLALGVPSTNQQPRPCSADLGLNPAGPLPPLVLAHASCDKTIQLPGLGGGGQGPSWVQTHLISLVYTMRAVFCCCLCLACLI